MDEKTFTFLFTDIEGSTRLWEQEPRAMSAALAHHNRIISNAIEEYRGRVFKMVGDGFCAVFDSPTDALYATLMAQSDLFNAQQSGEVELQLRVRMGLHTGPAQERDNDYFGATLNRVSRLMSAANGWQILVSGVTYVLIRAELPEGVELRDMGNHRLKDIREPEHLYQVISPDVRVSFVPIRTLSPRPSNLPASLTSFVGREQEERDITRRFRRKTTRLLTLTGPGGIGKTRLSLQAGSNLRDDYEDGVFFVDLAPLTHASAVVDAIAGALGIEETSSTRPVDALKEHLRERQLLLILDNFEHVMDAAPVMNTLLASAERLNVLITSRQPLRIYGEQTYLVQPLEIPVVGRVVNVDILLENPAVRLFVDRVQAAQPDFALTEAIALQVVDICRFLDGLPLALELAAGRVYDLALGDIVAQLNSRLTLLTEGPRDVASRQQTVRNTVDWSYQQLTEAEQQAFGRLAVFVGAFTGEAAASLMDEALLADLTRKSLLQTVTGTGDEQLYTMLATLREYARERLVERGDLADMQAKHAAYYLSLVEKAEEHLTGANQLEWFQRLEETHYNLMAALERALAEQDMTLAGRMVAIMWRHWSVRSRLSEGSRWMARVLEKGDALPGLLRARIYQGAGRLALLEHRYAAAMELLNTGLTLYKAENHAHGQASIHMTLGEIAFQQGETSRAENNFIEGLALFREAGDDAGVARCLENLGRLASRGGNFGAAQSLIEESLSLTRVHGSVEGLGLALNNLAEVMRAQQKYTEAAALYRESLEIYRKLEFNVGVAVMLHNLGQIELLQKSYPAARILFLEALELLKDLDDRQIVAECLAGLAGVYVHTGEAARAARYLGAAKALLEALNTRMDYADQAAYDAHVAAAKLVLEPDAWKTAWNEGQAVPIDQMIAEALRGYLSSLVTKTNEYRRVDPNAAKTPPAPGN